MLKRIFLCSWLEAFDSCSYYRLQSFVCALGVLMCSASFKLLIALAGAGRLPL